MLITGKNLKINIPQKEIICFKDFFETSSFLVLNLGNLEILLNCVRGAIVQLFHTDRNERKPSFSVSSANLP